MELSTVRSLGLGQAATNEEIETALTASKDGGYSAVSVKLGVVVERGKWFGDAVRSAGLGFLVEIDSRGPAAGDHAAVFAKQLRAAIELGPAAVVANIGEDMWAPQAKIDFFTKAAATKKAIAGGIDVYCCTGAGTALYHPWEAVEVMEAVPDLQLNVDLGQWCCSVGSLFEEQPAARHWLDLLQKLGNKRTMVTAGIGFADSARVPHPADRSFNRELQLHEQWWKGIWKGMGGQGTDAVPTAYVSVDATMWSPARPPFGQTPTVNVAEVARWTKTRVETLFKATIGIVDGEASPKKMNMSKKPHKKQSVTQAYVLTNDKPHKYGDTTLDFEDCEGAKDKMARLEACLGGLRAMVDSVMTPDKTSTEEWSALGIDMDEVPEEELSKLRGDKRSVARVVEGDEAEDDEEDLEDAHEDLDLEPGKIGVIITNENPKRGGKPKLVHRLIYPSFDDDTIKIVAEKIGLGPEELLQTNELRLGGGKKMNIRIKMFPMTPVALVGDGLEVELEESANAILNHMDSSGKRVKYALEIWREAVKVARQDAAAPTVDDDTAGAAAVVDPTAATANIEENPALFKSAVVHYKLGIKKELEFVKNIMDEIEAIEDEKKALAAIEVLKRKEQRAKSEAFRQRIEDEARAELAQERADEVARERAEQRRLKRKLKAEEDVQSGKKPAKKSRKSKPKPKPKPKEDELEEEREEEEVEDEDDPEGDEEVLMYTCNEDDTCAMIAEDMEIDVQELVDMNKPRFGKGLRKTSKFKAGTIVFMPVKPVVAVEAAEADPEKLDSFFGGDDTSKAAEEEAAYETNDGDTPAKIAKALGLECQAMIDANKKKFPSLRAGTKFRAGTSLVLPQGDGTMEE